MEGDYWVLLPWSGPATTRELLTHDLLEAHHGNLGQVDVVSVVDRERNHLDHIEREPKAPRGQIDLRREAW